MITNYLTSRLLGRTTRRYLFIAHYHATNSAWAGKKITQRFKLADIGEGITECEVIKWNITPNSTVAAFDPLCEVQSDKASVEITSPFDGVVKELLVKEGEVAKVGEGLCLIEVDEEAAGSQEAEETRLDATPTPAPAPVPETKPESPPEEPTPTTPRKKHPMDPTYTPTPEASSSSSSAPRIPAEKILAAPSVRHFARSQGVDLSLVAPGSGRDGRVEKMDIEAFLSGATSKSTSTTTTSTSTNVEQDVVVELGRTRYGMWKAMEKSLEIPHFGYSTSLDLTTLDSLLPILNEGIPSHYLPASSSPASMLVNPASVHPPPTPPDVSDEGRYKKLTYLPFLLKTLSMAMMEWPLLRSSITPSSTSSSGKPTLTIRPDTDISIALSTPTGLYTPTLQRVNTHNVYSLASQLRILSHLGRQTPCGLTPKEMPKRGGTISVSNVGAIGDGEYASPVLVPGGGVAIVAIGRAKWVWDVNRRPEGERRLKVGVSWSADHRVVEGAELAAFVETWRGYVEKPEKLIASGV
ncbi:hypothetical protein AAF712_014853 [Marasmius tenuissimus]|uniref:Dihydrolipoamide acetyltransferase component of pyruvate dehydrogenase complex n=1 Tax=Marasmius tenuissimus TaxID=585030 RepID=A0ABR2ZDC4_9AGAR